MCLLANDRTCDFNYINLLNIQICYLIAVLIVQKQHQHSSVYNVSIEDVPNRASTMHIIWLDVVLVITITALCLG